jgi:DNA mismatch repair protein MutL
MSKINVLDSKIYNRISAGEVVERPAFVVKELVENSIDAGATSIEIEVIDGGTASIRVSDNGSGIAKNDLKTAILPHATSKISTVDDLDCIKTLGFRGEALPSIASVSKFELTSKTLDSELGAKLITNGGENVEVISCGASDGTEVVVNNLFYNTPAREKFLKTPRSEEGEITSFVQRLILSNPNIAFKYIADGKTIYQAEQNITVLYG